MKANNFIAKLKAEGSHNDKCDLDKVYKEYHYLLTKVPSKDRGTFSLNVLCILCRNIDKVPSWRENIDNKSLLILSIDCIRETRGIDRPNRVKTLSCIYHLHKHIVRQTTPLPPELVLKISIMAFEPDTKDLLTEYSKTYWNIIADRLTYLGNIKGKVSLIKLVPKLTEDLVKVIKICDTVLFCSNFLSFLFKKLFLLYSDRNSVELNKVYIEIIENISQKDDLETFKKLQCKQLLSVYGNISSCLCIVTENCIMNKFKDLPLEKMLRTAISLIGHSPEIFHCLQTFYLNSICCIYKDMSNLSYVEKIFENILQSFEITEKLGYGEALNVTYPFLGQFVKLYIGYTINEISNEGVQIKTLQIILVLMKNMKYTEQFLTCENCNIKTGLHDALRLSFQAKSSITKCIEQKIDLNNILPIFYNLLMEQYKVLTLLGKKNCVNYVKCFRKIQTDVHNTAILLNKVELYEYSLKFFEVYIKNEILHFKNDLDMKNIARAMYNRSICQLDCKLYEDALLDVFLSQVFAQDFVTDKYMSLVMDIKAKANKNIDEKIGNNVQLMTVVDACKMAVERCLYGNLKPFLINLKFSDLLRHESLMYSKLWPSLVPIAGVCDSMLKMYRGSYEPWMTVESKHVILDALLQIVLETPSTVRTVQSEHFSKTILELIEILEVSSGNVDHKVARATLLFLKSEFEFGEASVKYGWKVGEQIINPDDFKAIRTYQQEYDCIRSAMDAVQMWNALTPDLKKVTNTSWLRYALHIAEIYVQQFLRLEFIAHGLQLAHVCCKIADFINDKVSFCRNVGTILYFLDKSTDEVRTLINLAHDKSIDLTDDNNKESFIVFICDCAVHYSKRRLKLVSLKFVRFAQSLILAAQESTPELNLDLAIGRLLEAQMHLCVDTGPSALSTANMAQRHYFAVGNNSSKWATRRLRSLIIKRHTASCSVAAARVARALGAWRRARAAAGAALPCAGARAQAYLIAVVTNPAKADDAQVELDHRLKHILGLQPSNEMQLGLTRKNPDVMFTPKPEIETMRDNMLLKKTQCSPSIPCNLIPAFKVPEFLLHDNRCRCYACQTPSYCAMTCRTFFLEASMYFRAKEYEIANNYFAGVFKILAMSEGRLKNLVNNYRSKFEGYIVDFVSDTLFDELKCVNLQILLDASYFELAKGSYDVVDSYIVSIHEIMQDLRSIDEYLANDVLNLMTASACLRKVKKPTELGLEVDFEGLTLSPVKNVEVLLTPESKRLPVNVKTEKTVHKDEDIPKKRRIFAKLNLDDDTTNVIEGKNKRAIEDDFKVPSLIATKHLLETATPVPETRSKPRLLLTQPSQEANISPKTKLRPSKSYLKPTPRVTKSITETPRQSRSRTVKQSSQPGISSDTPKVEFYTPVGVTSPENFFTPMTSVKTYSKKAIKGNIVKNLEKDFVDKENIKEVKSRRKALQRATSPGKLSTLERKTRKK